MRQYTSQEVKPGVESAPVTGIALPHVFLNHDLDYLDGCIGPQHLKAIREELYNVKEILIDQPGKTLLLYNDKSDNSFNSSFL